MENLTHSLTGVMLSRAGLSKLCPRATLLLVICSNFPDADSLTTLLGSVAYLDYHRHLTHALVMVPLMTLVPVLFVRWLERGKAFPWMMAMLVGMVGTLTHIGMDLWNNYGVRLLLPFSGEWFGMDAVMVVDIWILLVLGIALAAPWLSRLVGNEIGSKQPSAGRGWAIFCFAVFVGVERGAVASA